VDVPPLRLGANEVSVRLISVDTARTAELEVGHFEISVS
jgi:hypothetical protein